MSKLILSTVAVCLGMVSVATAHDPVDVAQRCVQRVNQVVERCENAAADETRECVRRINALQDAGRNQAAQAVAEECIRSAVERTRKCASTVERVCDECIEVLLRLGEPQLTRRVNNVCEEAVEDLRTTLQREKNIIRHALAN